MRIFLIKGLGEFYARKAMDKSVMLNCNKVHRACMEREIISMLDHPSLPMLYSPFQVLCCRDRDWLGISSLFRNGLSRFEA